MAMSKAILNEKQVVVCGVWYESLIRVAPHGPEGNTILNKKTITNVLEMINPSSQRPALPNGDPDMLNDAFVLSAFEDHQRHTELWDLWRACWRNLNDR